METQRNAEDDMAPPPLEVVAAVADPLSRSQETRAWTRHSGERRTCSYAGREKEGMGEATGGHGQGLKVHVSGESDGLNGITPGAVCLYSEVPKVHHMDA